MTATEFKDVSAGFQSIAIFIATFLGGGWALYQFFSLRALQRAKLELEKAKRELVERALLIIDLVAESFDVDGHYFLHVRVAMRNAGSGVEIADWTKAHLFVRKVQQVDDVKLETVGEVLHGWRAPFLAIGGMRFLPGFSTNESFLIAIPQAGVYYIEFSIPVSPAVRADAAGDVSQSRASVTAGAVIDWKADTFVTVPTSAKQGAPADSPAAASRQQGRG
jgi:hypothetical protein